MALILVIDDEPDTDTLKRLETSDRSCEEIQDTVEKFLEK
jgi:hypothetical protein